MPNLETLPKWARRLGRAFHVAGYVALALVGAIGLTWPPEGVLTGTALVVTRVGGGLLLGTALIAGVSAVWHRWLLELDVIPFVGVGLTAYAWVLLTYIGPQRWSLLVLGLIVVVLTGLAGRGVILTARVSERLRAREAAEGA